MLAARLNPPIAAFGFIAAALAIKIFQVRGRWLSIPLQAPLLLLIVSAWIGVSVSYDPEMSMRKFGLIAGGIALYLALASTRAELAKELVVWGLLTVAAGLAVFFVTQTDFSQEPLKIDILNKIGLALHRNTPQFGFHSPHANLMAGIFLLALPYALLLAFHSLRKKQLPALVLSGGLAIVIGFGLLMTTSRGAWLALALVAGIGVYGYVVMKLVGRAGYSQGTGLAVAVNLALLGVVLAALLGRAAIGELLESGLGAVNGVPRGLLYQHVVQLAQDYMFTGAGLDTFSPNFSTYELLITVPFLPHAHNLLLEIWYEQGLLGIFSFVWFVVAFYLYSLQYRRRLNWMALAGAAAVTMMLIHGMVDVIFYFSRVISLMFIPFGLTIAALHPFAPQGEEEKSGARRLALGTAIAAGLVVLALLIVGITRRDELEAQWTANQGALSQARIELPEVGYPHPTPHEVRREVDLDDAEAQFRATLERDSENRTANMRLGLIALDRFDLKLALDYLREAYRADPDNRAVLKALGYAYVWTGSIDEAEPLLRQIPEAVVEMGYATGEWRARGRNDIAANAHKMLDRLNND
jgi:O-antigen ligase